MTAPASAHPSAAASTAPAKVQVPPQWPPAVVEQYEPVRPLGKGGFATVMLAHHKTSKKLVAMKVVGSAQQNTKQQHGYAHREIDILRALSHPHIMTVVDFWEFDLASNQCAAVMALSYAKGPTLDQLLQLGGAFGLVFGRVTLAQLVDALAYCHSRAVIHRDIKPDNVVVTGATGKQTEIFSDNSHTDKSPEDWQALRTKWHVTLVDFGFARALSPDDLENEAVKLKLSNADVSGTGDSTHSTGNTSTGSAVSSRKPNNKRKSILDRSVSRVLTRTMSALGNRMYAAPEIIQGVQDGSDHFNSRHSTVDITKTLSKHVSNYGMLADAYSLGNTMKYMMTGVPPNVNADDFLKRQSNPLFQLCCGSKDTEKKQYRSVKSLPEELKLLIQGTTHPSVSQRTSVRAARRYPFVDDVLPGSDEEDHSFYHKITFLPFTMKHSGNENTAEKEEDPTTSTTKTSSTPPASMTAGITMVQEGSQ